MIVIGLIISMVAALAFFIAGSIKDDFIFDLMLFVSGIAAFIFAMMLL